MSVIVKVKYNRKEKIKSFHCPVCDKKLSNRANQPTCPDKCKLPVGTVGKRTNLSEVKMRENCSIALLDGYISKQTAKDLMQLIRKVGLAENSKQSSQLLVLAHTYLSTEQFIEVNEAVKKDDLLVSALIRRAHKY